MDEVTHESANASAAESRLDAALKDHSRSTRRVAVLDVLRYARSANVVDVQLDGHFNYHHVMQAPGTSDPRVILTSGINPVAQLTAPDGRRRPLIALRSSPWKAGKSGSPWHDEFDLDHGHVRYFGDHKAKTSGPVGATPGNKVLLEAWQLHAGTDRSSRLLAPPLIVWRARPTRTGEGKLANKGYIEFCGVAVLERLEHVVQRDPPTGRSFPNLVVDLNVVDLSDRDDEIDLRWFDDRRDAALTAETTLRYAPTSWRRWVEQGRVSLPSIRRRVLSSRVASAAAQRPKPDSIEAGVLDVVYRAFTHNKHAFEHLAAQVAAEIFSRSGATYREGWLTRAGGDGGMDFVGRLDVGSTSSSTPLIVLGQAKCIKPSSAISPDEVARVVARLRRGWIGIFVTTGVFSQQAQVEVIDDEYPVVLVGARTLAEEVRRLAESAFGGDVDALLANSVSSYSDAVTHRRPEEILSS